MRGGEGIGEGMGVEASMRARTRRSACGCAVSQIFTHRAPAPPAPPHNMFVWHLAASLSSNLLLPQNLSRARLARAPFSLVAILNIAILSYFR